MNGEPVGVATALPAAPLVQRPRAWRPLRRGRRAAGGTRVRILALGAADRGDGAAALLCLGLLPSDIQPDVEIRLRASLDLADLLDLNGLPCLVLDASRGIPVGAVRFIPFDTLLASDRRRLPELCSLQALTTGEVLALVKAALGGLPAGGAVLIGGRSFGPGELPSQAVASAMPRYVATVSRRVRSLRASGRGLAARANSQGRAPGRVHRSGFPGSAAIASGNNVP